MPETPHILTDIRHSGTIQVETKAEKDFPNSIDPLRAFVPLPYHHVLFPLGFPVHIKSNQLAVIRIAEESWGSFNPRFRDTPIEVRVLVSDVVMRNRPVTPVFRAQANLMTVTADVHNFACCDLSSGFGFACVTRATVSKREYLRNHFLLAMVYTLLDVRNVVDLHAACVAKDGHGVLLAGPSGAGKSSLAYACMRRGWTFIADDASALVRRRTGRLIVGNPQTFRFRPAASALFPELRGRVKVRNGKPTIEIKTEHLRHKALATECTVDHIVFLNRQDEEPNPIRLVPVSREDSFRRIFQGNVWPSELAAHTERVEAVERLLTAERFELTYKALDPAIDILDQLVRGGTL